ncbi:MAG: imidazole glycerol phosphate synthase subunit HisH [Candidatus Omnitrophica bacterium]|nr:imidazole glycerol phosphate synthase subunit HisH [Candidatus Omnitrophota bacterium]MDD5671009.1 imidazole glycerol phosphate synthase subunit HisH [Candidatus Omnitrophota bacterium]
MKVLVVDYKMGNLGSVRRSFEECGAEVTISNQPKDLENAEKFVLPGVGAFKDGMARLESEGWVPKIKEAIGDGVPMLGICLGMQLLAAKGFEGGEISGLNLIPGEVKRFVPPAENERIPHIGWNEVYSTQGAVLFDQIPSGTDFYFVHSYHFVPHDPANILAETPYCGRFVSAVMADRVFGVQFHPEKSGKPGFALIRNFLKI